MTLDTHELAWAAGFFDGEGCFLIRTGMDHSSSIAAAVSQMEPKTLERFCRAVGRVGTIRSANHAYKGVNKTVHQWRCNGLEDTQAVGAMLFRFLSPIKRAKFVACMKHSASSAKFKRNRFKQRMAEGDGGLVVERFVAQA